MPVVTKTDVCQLQLAPPFNVNLVGTVDQNIVNRIITQQHLQRPKSQKLVNNCLLKGILFGPVQGDLEITQDRTHNHCQFVAQLFAGQLGCGLGVNDIQQSVEDAVFDFTNSFRIPLGGVLLDTIGDRILQILANLEIG